METSDMLFFGKTFSGEEKEDIDQFLDDFDKNLCGKDSKDHVLKMGLIKRLKGKAREMFDAANKEEVKTYDLLTQWMKDHFRSERGIHVVEHEAQKRSQAKDETIVHYLADKRAKMERYAQRHDEEVEVKCQRDITLNATRFKAKRAEIRSNDQLDADAKLQECEELNFQQENMEDDIRWEYGKKKLSITKQVEMTVEGLQEKIWDKVVKKKQRQEWPTYFSSWKEALILLKEVGKKWDESILLAKQAGGSRSDKTEGSGMTADQRTKLGDLEYELKKRNMELQLAQINQPKSKVKEIFAVSMGTEKSRELCRHFLRGSCSRGNNCPYSHSQAKRGRSEEIPTKGAPPQKKGRVGGWETPLLRGQGRNGPREPIGLGGICWSFRDSGSCLFGNKCRFSHAENYSRRQEENNRVTHPNPSLPVVRERNKGNPISENKCFHCGGRHTIKNCQKRRREEGRCLACDSSEHENGWCQQSENP